MAEGGGRQEEGSNRLREGWSDSLTDCTEEEEEERERRASRGVGEQV